MPDSTAWALWAGWAAPELPLPGQLMVGCAPQSSHRLGQSSEAPWPCCCCWLWLGKWLQGGWCMRLCVGQQVRGVDGAGGIAVLSPPSEMGQHRVQCAGRGWQHSGTAGKPRSSRENPSTRCE